MKDIIVESDSMLAIQTINKNPTPVSNNWAIIREIKDIMQRNRKISVWWLTNCPRLGETTRLATMI